MCWAPATASQTTPLNLFVVAVNMQTEVEYLILGRYLLEGACVARDQLMYSDLRIAIMTKLTGPRVAIVISVVYLHSTAHLTAQSYSFVKKYPHFFFDYYDFD